MPGNSYDSETTYCEMNISTDALEDLHCLLDTHSENLQEKLLLLAVVTHALMTPQNLEYFESLPPVGTEYSLLTAKRRSSLPLLKISHHTCTEPEIVSMGERLTNDGNILTLANNTAADTCPVFTCYKFLRNNINRMKNPPIPPVMIPRGNS